MRTWLRRLSIAAVVPLLGLAVAAQPAHAVAGYRIVNMGSGKCLDVKDEDGANSPSASLQQYRCKDNDPNQRWITQLINGQFEIENLGSHLCVDVTWASPAAGAPLQQWYCDGGSDEMWTTAVVGGNLT
ncbi:MAG TPA: RICIN domain-containing protein, partial [Kineosporiaceae bacterium]